MANPLVQHTGPRADPSDAVHDNWHGPLADSSHDGTEKPRRRGLFRRRRVATASPGDARAAPALATTGGGGAAAVAGSDPAADVPPGDPPTSSYDSVGTHTQIIQPPPPGPTELRSREMRAYVASDERIVVQQRQHPIVLAESILTSVAVLLLMGLMSTGGGDASNAVLVLFFVWLWLVGRALLKVWDWYVLWFVITDKRVMLAQGVFDRKVGMLPLGRVTDMSFTKPLAGRILRYGTFIFESAGQDQALREIAYVRRPDSTYGTIVREIFSESQNET